MEKLYQQIVQNVNRYIHQMGPAEWFWVLAAMIGVGLVCMRGFGSRSGY